MMQLTPLKQIRFFLGAFMIGVFISGVTAFPLPQEVSFLAKLLGVDEATDPSALQQWIMTVRDGLNATQSQYKFIFYG
ncbi:MAG TPA: hypothetical protein VK171_02785, partial [Fimbriimonas sp.]|nr:hypothetical protein [Fimbriimonas sp.]